ncbi:tetratricopeptide repeat (TPR)-like superfamily protein [Wolffia australiana]
MLAVFSTSRRARLPSPRRSLSSSSASSAPTAGTLSTHFDRLVDRSSALSWNDIISDLARHGDYAEALRAFSWMRRLGVKPDRSTFPNAHKACGCMGLVWVGRQIHLLAHLLGLCPDLFVSSSLVDMYSKCFELVDAKKLFDETPEPNAVVWTAMIVGYVFNNRPRDALGLFKESLALAKVEERGGNIDAVSAVAALSACSRMSERRITGGIHGILLRLGLNSDVGVGNTLIDAYAKCGDLNLARQAFEVMNLRDSISWNSLISAFAQNGRSTEALSAFCEMFSRGVVESSATTLSAVLFASAQAGTLEFGRCIHSLVVKMGMGNDVYIGTSLVDMYCKCGQLGMARQAFDHTKNRNIRSWSAMIGGYAINGCGLEAMEIFSSMRRSGLKPNVVTFVSVLSACSHAGLVDQGRHWFSAMKEEYGIDPGLEHHACMVDLLGRAGKLREAHALITSMTLEPDAVIWGALLSACRVHKDVKLGELSAQKLFELDPKNCGYFVLLSNIYAGAGLWTEAKRMRVEIKSRGLVKPPGYSSIELRGRVHLFLVGDKEHPDHEEVYRYLEMLGPKLTSAGYVPDTGSVFHDIDQEEKESVLGVHSEKLAVGFGMIKTPPGTVIRVIKNLRICGDCHTVLKLVSGIEGRELVVRDSSRFHHFSNGQCSCGDYW